MTTHNLFELRENLYIQERTHQTERQFLSLVERKFSTEFAKAVCRKIYGYPISKDAWSNWRAWSGLKNRERICSYDQLCFLAAIAKIRRDHYGYFPELSVSQVESIANSLEHHQQLSGAITFLDNSGWILGADICTAFDVPLRTVYRKIKGFSQSKMYEISYLKTILQ